jgi:hypothetical protein
VNDQRRRCKWCKGDVAVDAGPCPLSFECPTCHAKPGQWCKRPSEHEAAELHADRLDLEFGETKERVRIEGLADGQLHLDLELSEPLPSS